MKFWISIVAAAAVAGTAQVALADVTRLEITSKQPYGTFQSGDYMRWDGKIKGELPPTPGLIPDIEKATRNARGMVEYSTRIILFFPTNPAKGNGALLVDVPNRGKAYAQALYNSPHLMPQQSGNTNPGTGFLEDQGFAAAEVYWELGQGADLPCFTDSEGKKRYVEGVGFAIVHDAADFLAHAAHDGAGTANPLAGNVSRVIASGKSQDGRFLKTFLLNGFNVVDGHRVFDGMHVFVSGAGLLPIMRSGTGPASSADGAPDFARVEFPGVHDGLLTIGEIIAKVEARGEVPPKMVMINSTTDYLSLRASLGRTGAKGTADLPLPANVRMYDIAGGAHATVLKSADCTQPPNRLDWAPVSRATLMRLDQWVSRNTPPPATTLMPLTTANGAADVLALPKNLPNATIQIPQRDADGNVIGGVRLPDIAVPLGVYALQNAPLTNMSCSLIGSYRAFDKAKLDSRYKDKADYVNRIRVAARAAQAQGFLLPEDAAVIINAAAETTILDEPAPTGSPR